MKRHEFNIFYDTFFMRYFIKANFMYTNGADTDYELYALTKLRLGAL
jgi:hypothetical protein